MASDLKSDLVMTSFQRRPTVHLMGNPAVNKNVPGRYELSSPRVFQRLLETQQGRQRDPEFLRALGSRQRSPVGMRTQPWTSAARAAV